jgi:hypothetical protein
VRTFGSIGWPVSASIAKSLKGLRKKGLMKKGMFGDDVVGAMWRGGCDGVVERERK